MYVPCGLYSPLFSSTIIPPLLPFTVDDDGYDPKASDPLTQGSPPLYHSQLYIHAPISVRSDAVRSGAVSFYSCDVFAGRLIPVRFHS
jgi:hypothetical protein